MRKLSYIYEPKGRAGEYAGLALNLYSGCPHGCVYCYAPGCLRKSRDAFRQVGERLISMELLRRDLAILKAAKRQSEPVHLCFACDPWPVGCDTGLTSRVIAEFAAAGQRLQTLTKNPRAAIAADGVRLWQQDVLFGVTLTTLNDGQAREWEPGAPSATQRVYGLISAKGRHMRTWVSLEPVIDPDAALDAMRRLHRYVDHWKVGRVNHCAELGLGVDWGRFRGDVEALAREMGMDVYVKESLRLAA